MLRASQNARDSKDQATKISRVSPFGCPREDEGSYSSPNISWRKTGSSPISEANAAVKRTIVVTVVTSDGRERARARARMTDTVERHAL